MCDGLRLPKSGTHVSKFNVNKRMREGSRIAESADVNTMFNVECANLSPWIIFIAIIISQLLANANVLCCKKANIWTSSNVDQFWSTVRMLMAIINQSSKRSVLLASINPTKFKWKTSYRIASFKEDVIQFSHVN